MAMPPFAHRRRAHCSRNSRKTHHEPNTSRASRFDSVRACSRRPSYLSIGAVFISLSIFRRTSHLKCPLLLSLIKLKLSVTSVPRRLSAKRGFSRKQKRFHHRDHWAHRGVRILNALCGAVFFARREKSTCKPKPSFKILCSQARRLSSEIRRLHNSPFLLSSPG